MRYAMIMAGGAGTRLWPMSRQSLPKQLLPFIHGRSLLELAAERLEGVVPPERRLICTGERFRDSIRSALPAFGDEQILGEPVGRDTVNAVGLTAAVLHAGDPDAVFAVLTSDHVIEPQDTFARRLDVGFSLVEDDPSRFVTFSITPTEPATGYGYVERGDPIDGFADAYAARRFAEKPDLATAKSFLAAGTFGWNSGMFVFHAGTFMEAMASFLPESHAGLAEIAAAWSTPDRRACIDRIYPTLPKTSVDYGIMEPAAADDRFAITCVPMDLTWLDVGSWPSFGDTLAADADGHRSSGRVLHVDSRDVLVASSDPAHLVVTIGCSDLMVIHTADATLVCPRDCAQDVKRVVDLLPDDLK